MFLVEPPPSPYDVHFQVFGFRVRVHPSFWILSVLLGAGVNGDPFSVLRWVPVAFVSILIHELGHAFVMRGFGERPHVVLYSFGGLAISESRDRTPGSQILISLAGPAAGFVFAAIILAALRMSGHELKWGEFRGIFGWLIPHWEPFEARWINEVTFDLLYINIFWGLLNLLPLYPLDGGQVSREVLTLAHPRQGIIMSLWLSIATGIVLAGFFLMTLGSFLAALFFGYLAYVNYQTLQRYEQSWR